MSNVLRTRLQTSKVFLLSSLSSEERREYGKIIQQLGGIYFDSESFKASCTHLICGRLSRSEKFLGACATGKWILRPEYISASNEKKEWLQEDDYEWQPSLRDTVEREPLIFAPRRWRLQFVLNGQPSFKGWKVSVLVSDSKRALVYKRLLTSGGAELYTVKMPVKDPVKIANTITFIFTDAKIAEQLIKQSLNEYGLLLLKPDFIGDYLIRDPPPDPMDYLVSESASPDISADRSLIQCSQDSGITSSQSSTQNSSKRSLVFNGKLNFKIESEDMNLSQYSTVADNTPSQYKGSKRMSRLRSNMETHLNVKPLNYRSQKFTNLPVNTRACEAPGHAEDALCSGRSLLTPEMPMTQFQSLPSSHGSVKTSRKLKIKPQTFLSQEMQNVRGKMSKGNKDGASLTVEDHHFLSLETASVNSSDTAFCKGMRRMSRRLAGVDPFIEYTNTTQYPEKSETDAVSKFVCKLNSKPNNTKASSDISTPGSQTSSQERQNKAKKIIMSKEIKDIASFTVVDQHFISLEAVSDNSNATASSKGRKRISRRLAGVGPNIEYTDTSHCLGKSENIVSGGNFVSETASVGSCFSDFSRRSQRMSNRLEGKEPGREMSHQESNKSMSSQDSSLLSQRLRTASVNSSEPSKKLSVKLAKRKTFAHQNTSSVSSTDGEGKSVIQPVEASVGKASMSSSDPGKRSQPMWSAESVVENIVPDLKIVTEDKVSNTTGQSLTQRSSASFETISEGPQANASLKGLRKVSKSSSGCKAVDEHAYSVDFDKGGNANANVQSMSRGPGRPSKRIRMDIPKPELLDNQPVLSETDSGTKVSVPQLRRVSKGLSGGKSISRTNTTQVINRTRDTNISDSYSVTSSKNSKDLLNQGLQKEVGPGDSVSFQRSSQEGRRSLRDIDSCSSQKTPVKPDSIEPGKDVIIILSETPEGPQNARSVACGTTEQEQLGIVLKQEHESSDTFVAVEAGDNKDSSPVFSRSRLGSLKQICRKNRRYHSEHQMKALTGILCDEHGRRRSSRNSSPVTVTTTIHGLTGVDASECFDNMQVSPKKLSQTSRTSASTPSYQASPRKLSQSSLQDFGFSSANKRHPRSSFSRMLSKTSSCSESPVSLSQSVRCTQPSELQKESELPSFVYSREDVMEQDAACITNSLEKIKIEKSNSETEVKPSKTETPTNSLLPQTCGVKRKIFEDNDIADTVKPIAKKMKLQHPVQSWVPIPLGLRVDQHKNPDESSVITVPSQIPSSLCNLIHSCLEEDFQQEALMFMQASSQMYPTSQTLNTIMTQVLLKAKTTRIAQTAYRVLMNSLSIHPPTSKLIKDVYTNAFSLEDEGQGEGVFCFVSSVISGALCIDDRQDKNCLLLQFLVAAFRHNFHSFLAEVKSTEQGRNRNLLRSCMLLQCLWYPSYMMFPNARTQQLLAYLEQCLLLSSDCTYKSQVLESILSLVSMAAQCCKVADQNGLSSSHLDLGERTSLFVGELTRKIAGSCIEDETIFLITLRNLQPSWLCLKVCQILLGNLDDYLLVIRPDSGYLTLTKIVSQYFFLLPRLSRTSQDKEVSDKVEITVDRKRKRGRALKTKGKEMSKPDTEDNPHEKINARINKKNHLGETLLHSACIKNDVSKLKQLLRVPDVDVNAQDNAGWTPLHEACNKGHIDCVEALLKYVPIRTVDSYFKKAGNSRRVDLLAANSDGVTPLHDAVANNRLDVCRMLLKLGGECLLKAQTRSGLYPKDLATTPSMTNLLTTPSTPVKHREDDIISSQDSISSPGPHRTTFLPSTVLYDQVLGQNGCLLSASVADCRHYITMVTYLLQSYLHLTQLMVKQYHSHPKTSSGNLSVVKDGSSKPSKENLVSQRTARKTCRRAKFSSNMCDKGILGDNFPDKGTRKDGVNSVWSSLNRNESTEASELTQEVLEGDLGVFSKLKHHLKNFSYHIKKITSPEDFQLLEMRLASMNICTLAALKSN